MVVEIQPEPSEDERAAILVAVEQLLAEDSGRSAGSRWWQTGLRDDLDEDELP